MSDLIRRADAIKAIEDLPNAYNGWSDAYDKAYVIGTLEEVPTAEPERGKWEEKETFHNANDNPIIEEWQSARCSVCHKYHTTPYMYYFNDYNFCPNCGARMKGADDDLL